MGRIISEFISVLEGGCYRILIVDKSRDHLAWSLGQSHKLKLPTLLTLHHSHYIAHTTSHHSIPHRTPSHSILRYTARHPALLSRHLRVVRLSVVVVLFAVVSINVVVQ